VDSRLGLASVAALAASFAGFAFAQSADQAPPDAPVSSGAPTVAPVPSPPLPGADQTPSVPPKAAPAAPANESDEEKTEEPRKPTAAPPPPPKPEPPPGPPPPARGTVAVLRVLDKITAETLLFEAPVGRRVRYKTLVFTVKVCETRGLDDPLPRPSAYVVITSEPPVMPGRAPQAREVFKGWMFANSPGLHPFEHPVYDAWLVSCGVPPPAPAAPAP
jgi:hypothetical protein